MSKHNAARAGGQHVPIAHTHFALRYIFSACGLLSSYALSFKLRCIHGNHGCHHFSHIELLHGSQNSQMVILLMLCLFWQMLSLEKCLAVACAAAIAEATHLSQPALQYWSALPCLSCAVLTWGCHNLQTPQGWSRGNSMAPDTLCC